MRTWKALVEALEGPDLQTADYYLSEGCGAFAYALWIAKGKPTNSDVGMISSIDGEPWFGDSNSDEPTHDFEATHVYYIEADGRTLDVLGYRTVEEMIESFRIVANIEGPWSPENFANEWMGEDDSKPLYGSDDMIREALEIIQRFPSFYGLV